MPNSDKFNPMPLSIVHPRGIKTVIIIKTEAFLFLLARVNKGFFTCNTTVKKLHNLLKWYKNNGISKIAIFLIQREINWNIDIFNVKLQCCINTEWKTFYWCSYNNVLYRFENFCLRMRIANFWSVSFLRYRVWSKWIFGNALRTFIEICTASGHVTWVIH